MRPKGWENPYKADGVVGDYTVKAFEAGADAYEEALKAAGIYGTYGDGVTLGDVLGGGRKGWLVFIEEKE